jgi:hypothetical protein
LQYLLIFFRIHQNARHFGTGKLDECSSLSVNVSLKLF